MKGAASHSFSSNLLVCSPVHFLPPEWLLDFPTPLFCSLVSCLVYTSSLWNSHPPTAGPSWASLSAILLSCPPHHSDCYQLNPLCPRATHTCYLCLPPCTPQSGTVTCLPQSLHPHQICPPLTTSGHHANTFNRPISSLSGGFWAVFKASNLFHYHQQQLLQ